MKSGVMIIGGTGFVGSYLSKELADRYEVFVSGRNQDICSPEVMRAAVDRCRPEIVINLAALTTVRETVERPRETYQIGFIGLYNLFEALRLWGFRGRFLQVSSSEIYGFPQTDALPLTEDSPPHPTSPYAVAKLAGEALCTQWSASGPFEIVIARPFTHIGPGQSPRFSVANFTQQIAEVVLGRRAPQVKVGSLSATRDFTDVRDVVRAYDLLVHQGLNGGVYNVCSGRELLMSDVIDLLVSTSGKAIELACDDARLRGGEPQRLCGSFEKLRADTGWYPQIPLETTLADMLAFETRRAVQRVRGDGPSKIGSGRASHL